MSNLKNTQLIVSETLYDSLGRPSVSTVPVQNDSTTTNNTGQLGFINDFVSSRDPQQPTSTWTNGGELTGSIANWVDPTSFCLPGDSNYAYQGTFYESDPASRTLQSSKPGITFQKSEVFSSPGYSDSYYANYFPEALYDVLPPSAIQIPNATGVNNSFTSPNSFPYMSITAQQTTLGSLGLVTQASWKDNAGRTQAKATVDSNNHYILKSLSYQTGATMSDGLNSKAASTAPIMSQKQTYLPNFFDTDVANSDSFYIKKQTNVLGQIVQTQSPDEGINVYYTDIFGRLRYLQTADQLKAGMIQYYLYDNLNRIIEVGLYPGTWDVSSFQQNTLTLATPQPAQAQVQKSITYDNIGSSFDPYAQGKVVQSITYPIASGSTSSASTTEAYTYDSWGRLITVNSTITNLETTSPFITGSYLTQYSYNGFSKVLQITYPSSFAVSYAYNLQGLVYQISYTTNSTEGVFYLLAFYTYNTYNQVTSEMLFDGNASTTLVANNYTYGNSLNQLTAINTVLIPTAAPQNISMLFNETLCYTDDPTGDNTQGSYQDGNIQLTSYNYGLMPDYSYTLRYAYDAFDRLYNAGVTPSGWGAWAGFGSTNQYGNFDANGNYLLGMGYNKPGTNQITEAILSAARNPVYGTATFEYTASGLTSSITYTSTSDNNPSYTMVLTSDLATRRPLQITLSNNSKTTDSFLYDSKGERIQKVQSTNNGTSVVTYVRGKGAKVLAEYDASNIPQTYYIQGPLGLVSLYDASSQQNSFVIRDHLGSTRMVYNPTTNQVTSYYGYDCFGNIFIADGSYWNNNTGPRYLYTGQEWDRELGLYNYHARQYDPLYSRRFLSPDPAHQFATPYIYAANNPINNVDPTGKVTLSELEEAIEQGPIFLGENHTEPFAREAIKSLIENDQVKKLFFELPNYEKNLKVKYLGSIPREEDAQLKESAINYISCVENMSGRKISTKIADLVKVALDKETIPIYLHDAPLSQGGGFQINNETVPASNLKARNEYSAEVINSKEPGAGSVILAGQYHFDAEKTQGEANTLHTLVAGDNKNRVFDLTKPLE